MRWAIVSCLLWFPRTGDFALAIGLIQLDLKTTVFLNVSRYTQKWHFLSLSGPGKRMDVAAQRDIKLQHQSLNSTECGLSITFF